MFPNRINLLPFWMPQMDVDIRKPVTHRFGIERPGHSTDASTSAALDDDDSEDELDVEGSNGHAVNDDDENTRRLRAARDALEQHEEERHLDYANGADPNVMDEEERLAHRPHATAEEDYPLYDSDDEDDDLEEAKRIGGWHYRWRLAQHYASTAGDKLLYALAAAKPVPKPTEIPGREGGLGLPNANQVSEKRFKAPKGKKIHVPVRVEPKVSFAAERTFLSWVSLSRSLLRILHELTPLSSSNSPSSSAPSQPRFSTSATAYRSLQRGLSLSSHVWHFFTRWEFTSGASTRSRGAWPSATTTSGVRLFFVSRS